MRIHRPGLLEAFWIEHPDAAAALRAWFHETKSSVWNTFVDLKARYPTVTILTDGRVAFDVCETKYRLLARIDLDAKIVVICAIGLHPRCEPTAVESIR